MLSNVNLVVVLLKVVLKVDGGNKDAENVLEEITRNFSKITEDRKVTVPVKSYRIGFAASWNHSRIIVVNRKRLIITGGSNYYTPAYLKEDPIHNISLQVSGAAITVHCY